MGLRFDGLYCCITKVADGSLQNRVFRFYEDGTVIGATIGAGRFSQGVYPLPFWFDKDEEDFSGSRGRYSLEGDALSFRCKNSAGSVDYAGTVAGETLFLSSHSNINGHEAHGVGYAFHPFSTIDGWRHVSPTA